MRLPFLPVFLSGAISIQTAATAAETRLWASYAELHAVFAKFNDMPAASRSRILFHLNAKPPAGIARPEEIRLAIASRSGLRPIVIDRDWRLDFPVENGLLKENPNIFTSLERGTPLVLRPQITLVPLPGLVWPLADLARGVDQANAAVRSQAGVFSLFAPKAKAVTLRFAQQGVSVRVKTSRGENIIRAAANGEVELPLDNQLAKSGATIHLPFPPREVAPRFKMTMSLTTEQDEKSR